MSRAHSTPGELATASDILLVERASDGDIPAFEQLARRYGPLMRAYARRLVNSGADADDVVQESLLQAWKEIGTLNDGAAVKAWLMRITGHRAIDAMRRNKPHRNLDEQSGLPDGSPTPEQAAVSGSRRAALGQALAKLPEEQRRCWVLKEYGGQSYDQIGQALGISPDSVRGRLSRARATLMKEMEGWR